MVEWFTEWKEENWNNEHFGTKLSWVMFCNIIFWFLFAVIYGITSLAIWSPTLFIILVSVIGGALAISYLDYKGKI